MAIWIMKGAFEAVPIEIDEAARIEGASDTFILWKLIVPLSTPALAAARSSSSLARGTSS
jgi:ABC-type glycerol-3-phosphate transport system permease component